MSPDGLKEIIDVGNDLTSIEYHAIAAATVFFYDFLLTLADEIEYAWHGRKSWVFVVFLANRYLPIGYQLWAFAVGDDPTFSQQMYERNSITSQTRFSHVRHRCDKTAFISVVAFVGTTFLAQVVLTLRIYAVTGKNRIITSCFGVITASQSILGLCITFYAATQRAQKILPVPLPIYRVCLFARHRPSEIGFTTISLVYDFLVFSLIAYLVVRSNVQKAPIPRLLRTIAQDATYYFLIIFTSHLVLELTLLFARPGLQLLPATGNVVYLPVMVTRLMISLKKATASRDEAWNLGEPTTHTTMRFAEGRVGIVTRDEIHLDTFAITHEGTFSIQPNAL